MIMRSDLKKAKPENLIRLAKFLRINTDNLPRWAIEHEIWKRIRNRGSEFK